MSEDNYQEIKEAVLAHIQVLFEEIEEEMAISHQEKYALLEDSFENATDEHELRVAFEQWYADHAKDLALQYKSEELWEQALSEEVKYDSYEKDEIEAESEDEIETEKDY